MKNNIYLYITIGILLASECFMLWRNHRLKSEIQAKDYYMERIVTGANAMETAFQTSIENAGSLIDGSAMAEDTLGNSLTVAELARKGKGNFLVCRYSDRMCQECVAHTLSILTDHIDSLDRNRIVFLASNNSRRVLKLNVREYGLDGSRVLNCPNLGIPADEAMFPYIMAVDSSLRVLSVYFPSKSTHGTDYDYRHVKYMYDNLIR